MGLAAADLALRERLARSGALFGGYHPEMARLHAEHARRLRAHLARFGWPRAEAAAEAAWLIVQHAIAEPDFQRGMLAALREVAAAGGVLASRVAALEDRIAAFEGRAQRFGTQLDWDEAGELSPWPRVEAPERVDERRAQVGLGPLAEHVAALRAEAAAHGARPPADLAAYRAEALRWARSVGW